MTIADHFRFVKIKTNIKYLYSLLEAASFLYDKTVGQKTGANISYTDNSQLVNFNANHKVYFYTPKKVTCICSY